MARFLASLAFVFHSRFTFEPVLNLCYVYLYEVYDTLHLAFHSVKGAARNHIGSTMIATASISATVLRRYQVSNVACESCLLPTTLTMLKPRFSLSLCRTYATRRPEKPPARFPDPLNNSAVVTPLEGGKLSFIHRPPPTAPSPHSTTLDPASPLLRPPTPTGSPLPPLLRPSAYAPAPTRLSSQDLETLRALRRSDPNLYSCGKLAKMFGCRPSFVSQVAALPRSMRRVYAKRQEAKVDAVKAGWGERKATVRAIRDKRRTFW